MDWFQNLVYCWLLCWVFYFTRRWTRKHDNLRVNWWHTTSLPAARTCSSCHVTHSVCRWYQASSMIEADRIVQWGSSWCGQWSQTWHRTLITWQLGRTFVHMIIPDSVVGDEIENFGSSYLAQVQWKFQQQIRETVLIGLLLSLFMCAQWRKAHRKKLLKKF